MSNINFVYKHDTVRERFENPKPPTPPTYFIIEKSCTYQGRSYSGAGYTTAIRNGSERRALAQLGNMPLTGAPFREKPPKGDIIVCRLKASLLNSNQVYNPKRLEEIGFLPRPGDPRYKITKFKLATRD